MPILFSNFTGICIRKSCITCPLLCFILTLFIFVYFSLTHESLYSCTFKRQRKIKLKSILFYYSAGKVWVWIFGTNIKARCGHMALSPQFYKRQRQEDLLLGIVGCMPIGLQVQWGTPFQQWNVIKIPHFLLWPTHLCTSIHTCRDMYMCPPKHSHMYILF